MDEELKYKFQLIYEVVMILLAILVVVVLGLEVLIDFDEATSHTLYLIDLGILIVFAIDYGIRIVFLAENRKQFFKGNILDLIAIIPFSSAFRAARIARLGRLGRLARLSRASRFSRMVRFLRLVRVSVFFKRAFEGAKRIFTTNGLHLVTVFTAFVVLFGALGMYQLEQGESVESFADSLWWSFVTTTTVGYGDIAPVTNSGRVLAAVLMVIGIGFVGMVTGTVATYFVKKAGQIGEEDEVIEGVKEKLDNFEELDVEEVKQLNEALLALKKRRLLKGDV